MYGTRLANDVSHVHCHTASITSNGGDVDVRADDAGVDANAGADVADAGTLGVTGFHAGLRRRLERQQRLGRRNGCGDDPD